MDALGACGRKASELGQGQAADFCSLAKPPLTQRRGRHHFASLQLAAAPSALLVNPRIGERIDEFESREVHRILVGHYKMRYELTETTIYVLRLWHTREDR